MAVQGCCKRSYDSKNSRPNNALLSRHRHDADLERSVVAHAKALEYERGSEYCEKHPRKPRIRHLQKPQNNPDRCADERHTHELSRIAAIATAVATRNKESNKEKGQKPDTGRG